MRVSLPAVLAFLCGFAATVVVVQHRAPSLRALHGSPDATHGPHHLRAAAVAQRKPPADPVPVAPPPPTGLLSRLREPPAAARAEPAAARAEPSAAERREAEGRAAAAATAARETAAQEARAAAPAAARARVAAARAAAAAREAAAARKAAAAIPPPAPAATPPAGETRKKPKLVCGGQAVESEVVYWQDTLETPATLPAPRQDAYLTFEYDAGGWNNIRMGLECLVVLGHVLRRTVVLPPPQPLYLISNNYAERRDFGFADFLNVTLLGSHSGWRTLSMDEFLSQKIKGAPVAKPQGRGVWKVVQSRADATLHSVGPRFATFTKEGKDAGGWMPPQKPPGQSVVKLDDLHSARHLHSPGSGSHRLLKNFYSFLYFQDKEQNRFYKRFVRDFMRYQDEIQCAAHRVIQKLRAMNGTYYAIHARRNDFQYRLAKISASDIIDNLRPIDIPKGSLVYLATDDPKGTCTGCLYERKPCHTYPIPRDKKMGCPDDPSWTAFEKYGWRVVMLGDFKRELGHLNPNYYGMVDQVVCSRAEKWAGAFWSTFSAFIHRLRGYHGLGEESYYHTPGKLMELRTERRSGPGWTRDWRAGWTDDDAGELIGRAAA